MIELAIFLTLLQAFDGWTTYHALKYPTGRERNKLIRRIIEFLQRYMSERKAEYLALLLCKGWAAGFAWLLALVPIASLEFGNPHAALGYVFVDGETIRAWLLGALTVLYVWIAVNNWRVLERLRG